MSDAAVKMRVQFYYECWKRCCVVLHCAEVQCKALQDAVTVMEDAANQGEVKGLSGCADIHSTNENEA